MAERKDLSVGTKVRNIKTRAVGEVTDFTADDTAVVKYEGQTAGFAARVSDLELLDLSEFDLVKKLVGLKEQKSKAAEALEQLKSEYAAAEDEMFDYLSKRDIESTKVYEGLGRVSISGQKTMASIVEENKAQAFDWIRGIGRDELIKPTIHPGTLSSFVDELRNEGKDIPKFISYFFKPKFSFTKK